MADIFAKLSALVHIGGKDECFEFLLSEGQSSRSWWVQHGGKCIFGSLNGIFWKLLDWISPNFMHWCILGQWWTLQFLGSKGQSLRWRWVKHAGKCTLASLQNNMHIFCTVPKLDKLVRYSRSWGQVRVTARSYIWVQCVEALGIGVSSPLLQLLAVLLVFS